MYNPGNMAFNHERLGGREIRTRILISAAKEEIKKRISPYPPPNDLETAIFALGKTIGELGALSNETKGMGGLIHMPTVKQLEHDKQILMDYLAQAIWR